ncbi:probable E3 ubiquitin-protein ligase RHY1A [Macadamia integrifolia]|uniref:probable E3 ubiquitin-protein ligase RHY1A n=1 Tax=Macadamia integrifolia TaxID=60698 RepID=UPI001C4EBEFF|nr:probable E3 ubiquitin-protein ligase RHY1A [Macadamia integrifolia]XP_042479482.1 probable E3 ubiquitin-protein ligase RHY1A [Macadamia integrifolia]XP_042479488.1 probable E3 ubiquitin-protein ligase RHY1A [Macadamia integrifolia]
MAGMLPGVECARRRRIHQGGGWIESQSKVGNGRTRRSAFCLYASNGHESHLSSSSSSSSLQRNTTNQSFQDEKLGGVAREAKERLDERLRAQKKPEIKRQSRKEMIGICENGGKSSGTVVLGDFPTEVFGSKKTTTSYNSKRFISWAKLGWRVSDHDECAVCLERFKDGETLLHLLCAHRFHSRCLAPWLENSSHCPCCRLRILI